MRASGVPDSFTVISGPEDGTEFAVTQREFLIGHETTCTVNPRLDVSVEGVHGRGAAVADGYSIRNMGSAPVYVNGKRVGIIRSQIARAGDILRIGHTELILECSVDGIASRSRGIALESDAAWALRHAYDYAIRWTRGLSRFGLRFLTKLSRKPFTMLMIAAGLYWFIPEFRYGINHVVWFLRSLLGFLFR